MARITYNLDDTITVEPEPNKCLYWLRVPVRFWVACVVILISIALYKLSRVATLCYLEIRPVFQDEVRRVSCCSESDKAKIPMVI